MLPIYLRLEAQRASGLSRSYWYRKLRKGDQRQAKIVVTSLDGESVETLIPKWRNIGVFEGEQVEKGEIVCDGPLVHTIF